jgi:uncharacterized protein (TIGR03435 family)
MMPIIHELRSRGVLFLVACLTAPATSPAQQPSFAAAIIRPSQEAVPFGRDGKTDVSPGSLRMQDVTVDTCIKWAYGVQDSQVAGPDLLRSEHYDITAKAEGPAREDQLKLMMQTLLADRFKLTFHRENRQTKGYSLTTAKAGPKLQKSPEDAKAAIQNTATGFVATSTTMAELAAFLAGPLRTSVLDQTNLPSRYNFAIDFTPYLTEDRQAMKLNPGMVILPALQDELGLKLELRKTDVEMFVVDHVEKPSEN